jgi:hypothetical protein
MLQASIFQEDSPQKLWYDFHVPCHPTYLSGYQSILEFAMSEILGGMYKEQCTRISFGQYPEFLRYDPS